MLIANIEDLRRTIKVNATLPFETVEPYIAYATTHYLQRYIGKPLYLSMVDYVKWDVPAADNVPMDELLELCKQAIGPLAVALGTDELSIMIGDSGHTVSKSDTKTPASDAKILLAKESADSCFQNIPGDGEGKTAPGCWPELPVSATSGKTAAFQIRRRLRYPRSPSGRARLLSIS